MEVTTRRVHFAACTPHAHEIWMKQMARNLTDPFDGSLLGSLLDKRYLIMDRDGKFSEAFRKTQHWTSAPLSCGGEYVRRKKRRLFSPGSFGDNVEVCFSSE
jgi:hypothetical protein